ncbi:hypothetical protein L0F63_002569 [Massospora cicadina]|nr:hypothetical protein L0F63_002569 [Massospora cicadina]
MGEGVAGYQQLQFRNRDEFEFWQRQVFDAVEELELSRNGTSRNFITERISKIVSAFFVSAKDKFACSACEVGIEAGSKVIRWDWTRAYVVGAIQNACMKVANKPASVCNGIAYSSGNAAYDILRRMEVTKITKPMACYAIGNLCPMPTLRIDRHPLPPRQRIQMPRPSPAAHLRILHLSDLHYDREYVEGAEADCNKPICCQLDSNSDVSNKRIKRPASKWGEYTCDASKAMLMSMLNRASAMYNYDMVLFTGDLPAHDMWKEAEHRSKATEQEAFQLIKRYFNSTPIYPTIGNHESVPLNQFPFKPMSPNGFYLYKFMAEQWSGWLGPDQLKRVSDVGYYSVNHSDRLKILVLNNNLFYTYNYYALLDPTNPDPNGMFSWMISELQGAEAAGQRVYIASHIPPGSTDFYQHWSDSYHRIIERYAHLLSAQFYGHLHTDEFEVFYAGDRKTEASAINTAYLAPSMSTMNGINPSFRVYTVDAASYEVVDYVQYYADLKYRHLWKDDMDWQPLYTARTAYGFNDPHPTLTPAFWHRVTARMESNNTLFDTYHHHKTARGAISTPCDAACRSRTICTLRAAKSKDNCALVVPFS